MSATSFAQQRCEVIFSDSEKIVSELARLRVDIENAPDQLMKNTLNGEYRKKLRAAEKANIDLSELNHRVEQARQMRNQEKDSQNAKIKKLKDIEENEIVRAFVPIAKLSSKFELKDIAISPDGRWTSGITVGNSFMHNNLYNSQSGKFEMNLSAGNEYNQFSRDGSFTIEPEVSLRNMISKYDLTLKKTTLIYGPIPNSNVDFRIKLSADENSIYVISPFDHRTQLTVFDTNTRQQTKDLTSIQITGLKSIAFSEDGLRFAGFSGWTRDISIFETLTLKSLSKWEWPVAGNTAKTRISGDGTKVFAFDLNNGLSKIYVGEVSRPQLKTLDIFGRVYGVNYDGTRTLIVTMTPNKEWQVLVYNIKENRIDQILYTGPEFSDAAMSADGNTIAISAGSPVKNIIWKSKGDL
jgi:hypothetical protein